MRARRTIGALAAAACGVAAAGCGGGGGGGGGGSDKPDPVQRFARQADAVCLQASAAIAATADFDSQIQTTDQEIARLRALRPPAQVRQAYGEFVDLRERRNAARKAAGKAIDDNDDAAYFRNRREYLRLLPQSYAAAARARLVDCAGQLPAADRSAIVTLLHREETHPQASDCRSALTDRFVSRKYQDLATCERELPRGASATASVATPHGTLPLAVARVSESGGSAPTRAQDFAMLKVAGQWRIDSIRPVQTGSLTPG
jgi:hypothetical protein